MDNERFLNNTVNQVDEKYEDDHAK